MTAMKIEIEIDKETLNAASAAFVLAGAYDWPLEDINATVRRLMRLKRPVKLQFDERLDKEAQEKVKLSVAIATLMMYYPKEKE